MLSEKKQKNLFIFFCLLPATLLILIFMVYPTVNVFFMSFFKWGGYTADKQFTGFNNFKQLIQDALFFKSFQNTILLIVIVTIVTLTLSLIFASILTREKFRGVTFFRVIFYIPNILSIVVIAAIFSAIYDPTSGLLNSLLKVFRLENFQQLWLGNQQIVIYSISFALIWQAIGYYMVMYMAAMASIPESLYEASALEGASPFKQFFEITLPLTWSTIRTTLTFFVISTINLSFLLVKAMTNGGPDGSTEVFLSYMYKQAYTNSSYGYGMAIGVVVFLFSFALSAILNNITKRPIYEF
ncbi:carbohydrate ABC transporter permease [Vagococcus acidifermentans]|uniref:carbohydrate ABC transporter permease n=1 Tax=Vagococcus acidifermentans TaxID=564710 RepID=UPI001FEB578D|nr:sugar ABC transporter permease [Vagococcus acidifermentans]